MSRRGWALFIAMCLIWGIPYLLIKVAVSDVSPVTLVFLRTVIGAIILLPIAAARGSLAPLQPHWRWIVAYTLSRSPCHGSWSATLSCAPLQLPHRSARRGPSAQSGVVLGHPTGSDDEFDIRRLFGLVVRLRRESRCWSSSTSRCEISAPRARSGFVAICYAVGPLMNVARRLSQAPPIGVVAASLVPPTIAYAPLGLSRICRPPLRRRRCCSQTGLLGVVCTALASLALLCAPRRGRPQTRHSHHVRQSRCSARARRRAAGGAVDNRRRRGVRTDPGRIVLRHTTIEANQRKAGARG